MKVQLTEKDSQRLDEFARALLLIKDESKKDELVGAAKFATIVDTSKKGA